MVENFRFITSDNEYFFLNYKMGGGEKRKEKKESIDYELLFYYSTCIITLSYVTFGIKVLTVALYQVIFKPSHQVEDVCSLRKYLSFTVKE